MCAIVQIQEYADSAEVWSEGTKQRRVDLTEALEKLEGLVRLSNYKKLCFFTVEQADAETSSSQPAGSMTPNDRQVAAAQLFKEIGEHGL